MKKPFIHALLATLYIVAIVLAGQFIGGALNNRADTIIIPMAMLGLFVLSAAVMGYLFLSESLYLLFENRKQEAVSFFVKVVGFFACFLVVFTILMFIINPSITSVETPNTNNSQVSGKLNINVVCERALSYMTFPDGATADKFVADCKEGKYPEVIEKYKAEMNLGNGAII